MISNIQPTLYIKKQEKEKQTKPKICRNKEITEIKEEICEIMAKK